jgi:hypothetical protein
MVILKEDHFYHYAPVIPILVAYLPFGIFTAPMAKNTLADIFCS